MKKIIFFTCLLISSFTYAQIKIGDSPGSIHEHSVLELESKDKVLVITTMDNLTMNSIQPLPGALVYNTDQNCVFTYNGSSWISLCDEDTTINVTTASTAPTTNNLGDFWINDSTTNNIVSIWNGTSWIPIDNNPRKGNGAPTTTTAPNPLSGQIYVDETTGEIYAYDGATWVNSNQTLSANNGVTINTNNEIQLGGVLTMPTTITTNATNPLAITGLENGDVSQDEVVTINPTTGVLTKVNASSLFSLTEEITQIIANDGDSQFSTPINLNTSVKIEVYRNGVRIDFSIVNNTTLEVETGAICYAGDEIKIVQLH